MFYAGQSPESDSDRSFLSFEKINYPKATRKSRYDEGKHKKYRVESGDTLASIAVKFSMTTSELRHLNHLQSDNVFVDEEIIVNRFVQGKDGLTEHSSVSDSKSESKFCEDKSKIPKEISFLSSQTDITYLKVTARYVTDEEGHIKGYLLLTPFAITFIPTLLDPAVLENDSNRFNIHVPTNKVGSIFMYNNPEVMNSSREQRVKMFTSLITPSSIQDTSSSCNTLVPTACDVSVPSNLDVSATLSDTFEGSNTGEVAVNPDDSIPRCDTAVDIVNCSKQSLLDLEQFGRRRSDKKQQYNIEGLDSTLSGTFSTITSEDPQNVTVYANKPVNFLCIVACPRFKKIKNYRQKPDEFWFMVSVKNTQRIMEYLLENAGTKLRIGEEIESTNWADDFVEETHNVHFADDLEDESKDKVMSETEIVYNHFESNTNNNISSGTNGKTSRMHSQKSTTSMGNRRKSFAKIKDALHNTNCDSSDIGSEGDKQKNYNSFLEWEIVNLDISEEPILDHGMSLSQILNEEQIQNILLSIKSIAVGESWDLAYSTDRHGWSLSTLYRNVFDNTRNACFLLIKDFNKNIFGAFCSHHIHMSEHFYGNGESFVFRWTPEFEKFSYSGKNHYFMQGDVSYFIVGCSNARNAIRITSDLQFGRTQPCDTFNSPALVPNEDFRIANLEVWSFY